ncbi:MAG: RES domain-containing protein [Cyanobacteria bacterium P01_A01_bin.83]
MTASVMNRTIIAFRIGSENNAYSIFSGIGSTFYPGRWNKKSPVIYSASSYSLALLEKLVHTNTGDIPTNQQWIDITIPVGTTYETVTTYGNLDWKRERVTKTEGEKWLKQKRSCIMFVPSVISPVEFNILINEAHPQFSNITTGINQPVVWDKRLFFSG